MITTKFKIGDKVFFKNKYTYTQGTINGVSYSAHEKQTFYTLASMSRIFLEQQLYSSLDEAYMEETNAENQRHDNAMRNITDKFAKIKTECDRQNKEENEKPRDDKGRFTSKQKDVSQKTNEQSDTDIDAFLRNIFDMLWFSHL